MVILACLPLPQECRGSCVNVVQTGGKELQTVLRFAGAQGLHSTEWRQSAQQRRFHLSVYITLITTLRFSQLTHKHSVLHTHCPSAAPLSRSPSHAFIYIYFMYIYIYTHKGREKPVAGGKEKMKIRKQEKAWSWKEKCCRHGETSGKLLMWKGNRKLVVLRAKCYNDKKEDGKKIL